MAKINKETALISSHYMKTWNLFTTIFKLHFLQKGILHIHSKLPNSTDLDLTILIMNINNVKENILK